mgnify:CR=1 FL=1
MISKDIQVPVITLDGPSGTGKGTLCHLLANHLGWHVLDSGAIYRALAFAARKKGIASTELDQLLPLAYTLDLKFTSTSNNKSCVFIDNEDVSDLIRSEQCGQDASEIAQISEVRQALLERQRAFAAPPGLVTDGRDMGTVVFPKAFLKIYLDASVEERAKRRHLQLQVAGIHVSLAQVLDELVKRDTRDTQRAHAPLVPALDSKHIDTTGLTIDQVFQSVLGLVSAVL